MRRTLVILASVAAFASHSSVLGAQSRRAPASSSQLGGLFEVTPYAGYMVFGNYLSGPLGTSLTNAPAPVYGVQLGMKIAPNVSMIGNLGTSNGDIQAGLPFVGGVSVAHSSMLLYDAGLQLDIPVTSAMGYSFSPFVQAGVGGMHYEISQSIISTTATNLAANVGVGANVSLGSGMALQLMAKDYIGKFNFQDATSFSIDAGTTNNLAFSAGVRFSF